MNPPTEAAYLDEALQALPVCIAACRCADHFHPLWSGLKATGLLRGVHAQAERLRALLAPHWTPGGHALIAGSADTGSLDVLHALYGAAGLRYTVVDACDAPLQLVQRRAGQLGLALRTVHSRMEDTTPGSDPWHLVWIHNTLSFLDTPARARFLGLLRSGLAPGGVALCAIRFHHPPQPPSDTGWQAWAAATQQRLRTTFVGHPELLEPLLAGLADYARARQLRETTMPHADVLRAEFAAAGLRVLGETPVEAPAVGPVSDLSPRTTLRNQVFVLG